jgi:hydrogenase maturation protease
MSVAEPKVLVIGYGNELRGDDAAGPLVARTVSTWNQPGVHTIAAHQLVPEMAEPIAGARLVIFVDAEAGLLSGNMRVQPIEPAESRELRPHASDPRALLALAQGLFGRCPEAWLVTVRAESFDFSERLSAVTEQGIAAAVTFVQSQLGRVRA